MSGTERWKHLQIPFADIKKATQNFKKEIGKGGYGPVYEGKLSINGVDMKVAVKRLNENGGQGLRQFWNEIDLLTDKKHENIITLIGYCDEGNEKIIVYEFAERGSLDYYFLFKNATYTLTWLQRLKIVVDVARGLDHLHSHLQKKLVIIHRDIKASNILLDDKWIAKISDFGLSKSTFSGVDRSTVVTQACGTLGYVEPELKHYFTANPKSDVYSFGMLLFEVLCGRLCNAKYEDGKILSAEVAEKYYTTDTLNNIIDPSLRVQMNQNAFSKFSAIAYKCLQRREQRPLMDVVKRELEETLRIQGFNFKPIHSMLGLEKQMALKIPLLDIMRATNSFDKYFVIGRGGFGYTYSGELSVHGIYTKVAINRSSPEFGQGIKEFLTEIQLMSSQQHENLISLVGYCDEENEKILVYEYAEHGSLDQYISYSNISYSLTWLERLKIVVDVARGLDQIHNRLPNNQVIIHRDIKSTNILLDDKWVAKICDFGLSKLTLSGFGRSILISQAVGTIGYIEPEYLITGSMTKKSDVYSFGIVLFEVLCGRLSYVKDKDGASLLRKVVKEYYDNNKLDKIIDPILREQMSPNAMSKFSAIAYKCLQDREQRPLMDVVKKELEETLKLEVFRWRTFISRHWYILDVENLSSKLIDTKMEHEEPGELRNISISREEDITDNEHGVKKLANRYQHYIRRSNKPLHYTNKNELYHRLWEGFLCDNGQLWFSLCKSSDRICSMLPATQILRGDTEYEHLDTLSLHESRFGEVKVLGCASSYSFTCTLQSQMFSPQNIYACYLAFKFEDNNKPPDGNYVFTAEYGLGHGILGKILAHLDMFSWSDRTIMPKTDDVLEYDLECWMEERKDDWREIMLSKPLNGLEDHLTLELRLSALNGSFKGIMIEGIEFRPYV